MNKCINTINYEKGQMNGVMGGGITPFHPFDPPGPVIPPGSAVTTLLTMDYCGSHVYRNGSLERTENDYGYLTDSTYYYYIRDYQGNVRAVIDQNGALKEINNYYPYGGLMGAASAGVQPNKYGGKELDRQNGIDWYDSQARMFDPMIGRTTTMDPLVEKNYSYSPYIWCKSTPINRIDPNGAADFWYNGKVIGNDGINDSRVYVIKTTEKSFGSIDDNSLVEGAGLSKHEVKTTVAFIKDNSGNSKVFLQNSIAYDNSIEIEGAANNRQEMVAIVMKDNGSGGTTDANNREYGGYIKGGKVIPESPGDVSKLGTGVRAEISLEQGCSSFHSHPSGTLIINPNSNSIIGSSATIGGLHTTYSFIQSPSPKDISLAGDYTHYVFGRGDNNVYIYNKNGVQAVIPMKLFVTPK